MANNKRYFFCFFIVVILISLNILDAQTIDPNRGEKKFRREVSMSANNVDIIISNNGIIGNRDYNPSRWPKGSKRSYPLEISILAGADVTGIDNKSYKIISESNNYSYDSNSEGKKFCWNPKPGYYNENRHSTGVNGTMDTTAQVAHSADPSTWPVSWKGKDASWNGAWNSFFGKNKLYADDETFYVMDDFDNSEFPYYPFASDTTKRGLGLQCETRIFQWAEPNADDQVFMQFSFTNASDNIYDKNLFFGAFGILSPGGLGSTNNTCLFDNDQDMVFSYNAYQLDDWYPYIPSYMALKLLESPGFSSDGIDNDQDGITDESCGNDAGTKYVGRDNIIAKLTSLVDISKFMKYYGYTNISEVPAVKAQIWWTGDENADWEAGTYLDDIGSDGIGPLDPNYFKPDADGTEGNGKPDKGEPHFGVYDKNESDQIGLTSFSSFIWNVISPDDDQAFWNKMQPGTFEFENYKALYTWIFASGPLTLNKKQTESLSAVLIFGSDEETIFRKANISQLIYNNNYFSTVTGVETPKELNHVYDFNLEQNYPNPFNPSTTINFSLPKQGFVSLKVYDLLGHEVAALINETLTAGKHKVLFDTADFNLSSGIYLYQLKINNSTASKKMMLIK